MAEVHAEAAPRTTGERLGPPITEIGILAWLKQNLFSTWYNALLTLFCLWLLWQVVPPLLGWALLDADFTGTSREDCTSGGACWVFVKARFWQFMYGFYPLGERWRVNLAFLILIVALVPLFLPRFRQKLALAAGILVLYPIVAYCLFYGGVFGLPVVKVETVQGDEIVLRNRARAVRAFRTVLVDGFVNGD